MRIPTSVAGRSVPFQPAICFTFGWLALGVMASTLCADSRLISRDHARHVGLERPWFAQVRLDRSRNHVERAVLSNDRLDVVTSAGVVQEFHAETGETLWIAAVGNPLYPNLGPAASESHVALINGSTLYVLDRTDGRPVKIRRVGGAPGAAPALSSSHVFVPLMSGRVEGYPLAEEVFTPWYYQSVGRASVPPISANGSVVWATDSGHMYLSGGVDEPAVRSRLETGGQIFASPAYRKPYIFVATLSGEVFAVNEDTGRRRWKYAGGFPIARAPAAVGERVFVTTDEPALHCVDASTGVVQWVAPDVEQFAAASQSRVYGVDELNAIVVLDATNGAPLARMPIDGTIDALVNDQTDRLYLVSNDGTVQCLREIGAEQPLYHNPPPTEDSTEPQAEAAPATPPAEVAAPADDVDPFSGELVVEPEEPADAPVDQPQPEVDTEFGVEDDPFQGFD